MLRLHKRLLDQIHALAEQAYPEEGAGLLLGRSLEQGRLGLQIRPVDNTFDPQQRRRRYMIDPMDMLRIEEEAEAMDLEVIGVFHSHPDHPAEPSEFDRQQALPWFSYLITRVSGGKAVESRSWRLNDEHEFEPEEIYIQEDAWEVK
jgi:proteasome lid subunit RPN8/RPN11